MSANKSLHSPSRVSFPLSERRAHPGSTITNKTDSRRLLSVSVIVKRKNPLDLHELAGRQISQTEFSEKVRCRSSQFRPPSRLRPQERLDRRGRSIESGTAHHRPSRPHQRYRSRLWCRALRLHAQRKAIPQLHRNYLHGAGACRASRSSVWTGFSSSCPAAFPHLRPDHRS